MTNPQYFRSGQKWPVSCFGFMPIVNTRLPVGGDLIARSGPSDRPFREVDCPFRAFSMLQVLGAARSYVRGPCPRQYKQYKLKEYKRPN